LTALRRGLAALAALILLAAGMLALLDTAVGHRWIAGRIAAISGDDGLRYRVGRIDGSIYTDLVIVDLQVHDLDGLLLSAPRVELDWRPWRWIGNTLAIDRLHATRATLFHRPRTRSTGRRRSILPGFDIEVGRLAIDRLALAAPVLGTARIARVDGAAEVRRRRALVRLDAAVTGSDRVAVRLDAEPDRDRFDLAVDARGARGGALARMVGAAAAVTLDVRGRGSWTRWRGTAAARVGPARSADLSLAADAGRYTLAGTLVPTGLARGKLLALTGPRMAVKGEARFDRRQLTGSVALRSPAMAARASGTVDLAENAWRGVSAAVRLLRPQALFRNLTGDIRLAATLNGRFATAAYTYALVAPRFALGKTGFEQARAGGRARLSAMPMALPVRFAARRVTGVGEVAGGILANLSVDGVLKVRWPFVRGEGLRLRSDKLTGALRLLVDLRTGRFDVGLEGGLSRYLIPGIGVVDVGSTLQVVPGPGGRGERVSGRGTAQVVRLDNGFFASLTGGLPRIDSLIDRGPDGILRFTRLMLVAPQLQLAGSGYRRRDGTVHIEAAGRQARYGAVRMVLDGRIGRPTIDLLFDEPNRTLGLRDVRAHLDPTPAGFAFIAGGRSRLGPFAGAGAILLPPRPAPAAIEVARLDVTGTRASGRLGIVDGGFAGTLAVAGGGWSGRLALGIEDGVQRIAGTLDAVDARVGDYAGVRRGRVEFTTLLDPAGTRVEGNARGEGLRRGRLDLARFAGALRLVGDTGELRASVAGRRGRAFDIQTVTAITPDGYAVAAQGTLDRRPLRLLERAVIARDGNGWRLAPTRLAFAGGEARVGARWGGATGALEARLTRMPLAILDIGHAGLGLGGTASGDLRLQSATGAPPTGRIDITVRGLSRSGLLLSSRPIDVALAGVLAPDRLGMRAVMASDGRTIGRAQALLRLPAGGGLADRVQAAPVTAQLRYAGPADTLWRLTGVELFDLSGPVRIAADVGGAVRRPQITGALQASGARIESATSGTVLTRVEAAGRFAGSTLAIDRFAADARRGGRVTGSGRFDFAAANGIGMDVSMQAARAVLIARDDIGATVSGPLRFRSDGAGGIISGDVTLDAASYRLGRATAASAVPRLRITEINVPEGATDDQTAPDRPWRLDIRARAPNGVAVNGLGLSSEWSADLRLGGLPSNPAINGTARLVRGNYEFAGRDFALERGVIRFDGSVPANPALDIEANADATGLNASIRVTGTGLTPEVGFASTPPLPQDELLSRLLFGTSITNLSAPEALQLAAAVAALQDGGQGLNPINAVRRAAGLDRLRILPADAQTGQGTSVAAGKYVTRRLYAEIITDGQGYSATRAEFQVTRWLSLLSSISTIGRQSANVRISRDY